MTIKPAVTILIPNYKTPELTRLCLRLLSKHTPKGLANYIVIDNDSKDDSLAYLKTLSWITLIERPFVENETPPQMHARALDLGLSHVKTPYVLSIHTDTLVKHPRWLNYLLDKITSDEKIAGVGSWKLESKPFHKRVLKQMERKIQLAYYTLINKKDHAIEGIGKNYYYLRSHCALYRTSLLQQHGLKFDDDNEVAGKVMHKKLTETGYRMLFLSSEELGQYIDHINHATMILNPALGASNKTIRQGLRRIRRRLKAVAMDAVLKDDKLDIR